MNGQWAVRALREKLDEFAAREPLDDGTYGLWRDGYRAALADLRDLLAEGPL